MNKSIALPLAISIIAVSFAAIFVKMSSAPSSVLSMYRLWFASLLLLPFVWKKRSEFRSITKKDWLLLLLSGFFLALHFLLWFSSLKLTTVASSTIILAVQPLISLAGGFFIFRERTTLASLATIVLAIFGVALIGWGDIGLGKAALFGDFLSFLSVVAVVVYLLIGQNAVKKLSHWIYSFTVFAGAALFLTMYNVVMATKCFGYSYHDWTMFVLLATVPTLSHVISNWLLNYVNATTISMSILGEPVGATLLAVLLLGEKLIGIQMVGGILVLASVFFFLMQQGGYKEISEGV